MWQALEIGVDAIASVSATEQISQAALEFKTSADQRETLSIEEPVILGEFIVSISDADIEELFAPMTPDGPAC